MTDNDGDVARLKNKYKDYVGHPTIDIEYDSDESYKNSSNHNCCEATDATS